MAWRVHARNTVVDVHDCSGVGCDLPHRRRAGLSGDGCGGQRNRAAERRREEEAMKAICHCGATTTGKRLSRAWRRRGDRYICPRCWSQEPAERNSVYRYDVIAATIPPTFWRHQQTARLLWDGLCAINEQSFERVTALRARYAPAEAAVAERAREAARVAWQAVADARSKDDDREMSTEPRAAAVSRTKGGKKEQARAASQLPPAAFPEAKRPP